MCILCVCVGGGELEDKGLFVEIYFECTQCHFFSQLVVKLDFAFLLYVFSNCNMTETTVGVKNGSRLLDCNQIITTNSHIIHVTQ